MLNYVKMHGIGNDYVYLDAVGDPALATRRDLDKLAIAMSHRHKGIGSDGLILVCLPTEAGKKQGAHVRMRMFNADGSESAMCGNGIRCVAKFAHDRLGFTEPTIRVETGNGTLAITYTLDKAGRLDTATVDMGEPTLELEAAGLRGLEAKANTPGKPVAVPLDDHRLEAVIVGTGNPHAVFFIEKDGSGPNAALGGVTPQMNGTTLQLLSAIKLESIGPRLAHHAMFKNFTNVHIAAVQGKKTLDMRTWERGSGITQACGTGACAVVVAGVLTGRLGREVKTTLPGGTLNIRWDEATNHVFMTGPAAEICTGQWPDEPDSPFPPLADIPTLSTQRLTLRPFTHSDAPRVQAIADDRRISDMVLTVPHPYHLHHATGWISTHRLSHNTGMGTVWAVCDKATGQLIGAMGVHYARPPRSQAEAGWWFDPAHWNKGYATEAGRAVLQWVFSQRSPVLERVEANHFVGNEASGRVMQKMGMAFEALCKHAQIKHGKPVDSVRYAITRAQWQEANR